MKSFFVSSTFKDMQAERDLLHQSVIPALRHKLKSYGEDIQELDLRWGVDTSLLSEEESGLHVIESCIDSIDRCRPYMIIFIGERYGWIPDKNILPITNDHRLSQLYSQSMSITQMEIIYGALKEEDLNRCLFCFRDEKFSSQVPEDLRPMYQSESAIHREKLTKLKEKIKNTAGAKIIEYSLVWDEKAGSVSGLEQLEEELSCAIWETLKIDLPDTTNLSLEERILTQAELTAEKYNSTFITRDSISFASLLTGRHGIWAHGETGCGKSALLSHIFAGVKAAGYSAFIYYTGNENCDDIDTFLNTLLYWLTKESIQPIPAGQDCNLCREKKLELILSHLKNPAEQKKVILIDIAKNQVDFAKVAIKIAAAFPKTAITSSTNLYQTQSFIIYDNLLVSIKLEDLRAEEVIAIAQLHAKRKGKHLDMRTQDAIRKKQRSRNPYYLSLILQYLFMMDGDDFKRAEAMAPGMEGLSLYLQQLIEKMPDDMEKMTLHTLNWALSKVESSFKDLSEDPSIMRGIETVFEIAKSEHGLTMSELEEIASSNNKRLLPVELHKLLCLMYDSFQETASGRWKCSNSILRKSILALSDKKEVMEENQNQLVKSMLEEADTFQENYKSTVADTDLSLLADSMLEHAHLCLFRAINLYEQLLNECKPHLSPKEYQHVCRSLFYTTSQRIDIRLVNDVVKWTVDRWVPIYLGTSFEEFDRQMESDLLHQAELAEDDLQKESALRRASQYYEKIAMRRPEDLPKKPDPDTRKQNYYSYACESMNEAIELLHKGDIAKGPVYARSFVDHVYNNFEWFEELFTPESSLSFYKEVIRYRESAPIFDRSYQVAWMQLADFGTYNCQRLLVRDKDTKWLKEGLTIAKEQREHMEKLLNCSELFDDKVWYQTHIWETYELEQCIYMDLIAGDIAPEEEWLPAMLETVYLQLEIPSISVSRRSNEKVLEYLYKLKAAGLKDQIGIQKAIDALSEKLGITKDYLAFTLQQKAIEQNLSEVNSQSSGNSTTSSGNTFDILDSIFSDL